MNKYISVIFLIIICLIIHIKKDQFIFKRQIFKSIIILVIASVVMSSCYFYNMDDLPEGDLIYSSTSPSKNYRIDAFRCSGNATTDFSIRCSVYNLETKKQRNIYWAYHQEDVDIKWISESDVNINGMVLNVLTDSYDWRR